MSLILCPECGSKISDKAKTCPHCGYTSADCNLPISTQDRYEYIPSFQYDIVEWKPNKNNLSIISNEDNKKLIGYFGDFNIIQKSFPSLANTIQSMADKETILVANMDSYIKEMIEKGIYRLSVDKNGEILPTIRDATGIVKQVRLEEIEITPELATSLNHLNTHATMAQILDEIEYVGDAIREIHVELQNDRIAMAESARDKLLQARRIKNSKLREIALLNVISSATDAKRILMKNFTQNIQYIEEHSQKSFGKLIIDFKGQRDIDVKAVDSFQALISITNAVQNECEGYAMLDEYEAAKECLIQFRDFIIFNKIDNRDILLMLNGNLVTKQIKVVDEFSHIARRITEFDSTKQIGVGIQNFLIGGTDEEEKN
ncbi:zinc ribbon domain-containing protein [Chakrabartyella piscis]|uniref:zinc ribbon domain-containing protein n=1 Tax=Chakrabartyella piscis TaxID=2918914 RepID=UPI002958BB9F|nr:zinc ribbon domain-containing protein [Chakrabartyella piscis]